MVVSSTKKLKGGEWYNVVCVLVRW
jgi:hypothetical protein